MGCSFAQFVREAALVRAMLVRRTGGDMEKLAAEIVRLARRGE